MSYKHVLHRDIDLHVADRISPEDAARQQRTAQEILRRLYRQPGLILADEVGMGKTFVALAVAVSVALADRQRRPVVVMVPPSLRQKWPADFELFRSRCLTGSQAVDLRAESAYRAVDFLKLLDDPPSKRASLIFLTHGAMCRQLSSHTDSWVKLALIKRAIDNRPGVREQRKRLARIMGDLLRMKSVHRRGEEIWLDLLKANPYDWLDVLHYWGVDPEGDDDPETDDDPVPAAIIDVLGRLTNDDLSAIREVLDWAPVRRTASLQERMRDCRRRFNAAVQALWYDCVRRTRYRLPLLVLDEAHHLKNAQTQLASLFRDEQAAADADEVSRGPLAGVFERMLFLTATPFQLGHAELCSVLDRFTGINWRSKSRPKVTRAQYVAQVNELRSQLDSAQMAALGLDQAWGRLRREDLVVGETSFADADAWWPHALAADDLTPAAAAAVRAFRAARTRMQAAEELLRPWVIRHLKPTRLPGAFSALPRRMRLVGRAIQASEGAPGHAGLTVDQDAVLPFLLAARATAQAPDARPVFAEGLASSYETFLHTRRLNRGAGAVTAGTDLDGDEGVTAGSGAHAEWYLEHLEELVTVERGTSIAHPKVDATVARAADLWQQGEKVLVFCHYVVTGRVLRQRISAALLASVENEAATKLGLARDVAMAELERIGRRFDPDQPLGREIERFFAEELTAYPKIGRYGADVREVFRRYVRTPSFLVRYLPLGPERLTAEDVGNVLRRGTNGGASLKRLVDDFFEFLEKREEDIARYLQALDRIQTGFIRAADVKQESADDSEEVDESTLLMPTVRLVNGSTKPETRQAIMLAFNTPFYPDVLIASSVMAEGVDLHLNCRHIIHHDLCWNPSTLEQRTGRVDRIGAKIERFGQPLQVYLPYIAETQDEKMYRVVMDRERWFGVVMGERYRLDARTVDRLAERVEFPEAAARELGFRLEVGA